MGLSRWVNAVRSRLGLPYWSLSKMAKHKVKNAVEFISRYEEVVARAAAAAQGRRSGLRPHPHRRVPHVRRRSNTGTTATGSRAATRWSSMSTGGWKSSTGPTKIAKRDAESATAEQAALQSRAGAIEEPRCGSRIVTDAWAPQVNGVVRTLQAITPLLEHMGPRGRW